ncbi:hypothetical protein M422DRAFT_781977 [Sphaerobolus stellatus SS14]|uniref:Uncharacterized protein n=1 Tax=Sphaerobolus stellatus (strain SS14) TaxID=990650 RepID=A0A0C9UQH5_SPHS4|nr:hypothetical protein M422DRAFT_781977 [Sphaerobolus stellatus SS14]
MLPTSFFYIAPQNLPADNSREVVDFILPLVVFNDNDQPVLIVEVKDDIWAQKAEFRYRTDKQMRESYQLMLDDCPTPSLGSQPSRHFHTCLLWRQRYIHDNSSVYAPPPTD